MSKVTIIVPIYKVEKYLRGCFESLLAQTSKDFTVLAVNDGSPDGCDEIIKEYRAKYPEVIKGIKKENGGYGTVLEIAIKECGTPYFMVCDPDDTLEKDAVATLLSLAEMSGADLTVGAKTLVYEDSPQTDYDCAYNKEFTRLKSNTVYSSGTKEFEDLFFIDPSPHAKLYRTELVKDVVFPAHVGYTDNLLFYMGILKADKVVYTDKALARYLINRTGNTMTDVSFSAMNGQIRVFKTIVNQAQERRKNIPGIFWYRMFAAYKFMLYQSRRMNCTEAQYDETMDYLGTYVHKLTPYREQIQPYYKQFEKTAILEKTRDLALLHENTFKMAQDSIKKKMVAHFAKKR